MLAWIRELDGERALVLLNTGDERRTCDLRAVPERTGRVVVATGERDGELTLDGLEIDALEGIVLRLIP